jgi:hypothetical protein
MARHTLKHVTGFLFVCHCEPSGSNLHLIGQCSSMRCTRLVGDCFSTASTSDFDALRLNPPLSASGS